MFASLFTSFDFSYSKLSNEQLNIVNDDAVEQKNHDNNSDKVNTIINKTKPLDDDKNNNNNNNKGYVNKQTDKKSRWGDTTAVECIPIVKTKSIVIRFHIFLLNHFSYL